MPWFKKKSSSFFWWEKFKFHLAEETKNFIARKNEDSLETNLIIQSFGICLRQLFKKGTRKQENLVAKRSKVETTKVGYHLFLLFY